MKNRKLLFYSLSALTIYFYFDNASVFDGILQKLEKTYVAYAIGYYILIKIGGFFLLLFGGLGVLLFICHLAKPKN